MQKQNVQLNQTANLFFITCLIGHVPAHIQATKVNTSFLFQRTDSGSIISKQEFYH